MLKSDLPPSILLGLGNALHLYCHAKVQRMLWFVLFACTQFDELNSFKVNKLLCRGIKDSIFSAEFSIIFMFNEVSIRIPPLVDPVTY